MLWFLTLLLLLCIGQADVAQGNRVPNRTGSQCVWASLETIARHLGMTQLYDLTARYKSTAEPGTVNRVLSSRGIKHYWHDTGKQDWVSLKNATAQHWPVAVGISGVHMLVVVDATDKGVKIIDNSDPKLAVREWDVGKFKARWDGWYVAIPPPSASGPGPAAAQPSQPWSTALWHAVE